MRDGRKFNRGWGDWDERQDEEPDRYGLKSLNDKLKTVGSSHRYVPLDDGVLDDVLSGEIDLDELLKR